MASSLPRPLRTSPVAPRWIAVVCAVVLLVLWALGLWRVWTHTMAKPFELDWSPYAYSDDLIDYAGGFVRRGLGGEILRHLGRWSGNGTASLPTVNGIVFAVYALFSLVFLWCALRIGVGRRRWLAALVLWLVPGGPLGDAMEGDFYPRKDLLFLLFVLGVAVLAGRVRGRGGTIALLAGTGAGSAVLSLIHEGFLFMAAIPVALVLFDHAMRTDPRRAARTAGVYLAVCAAFFIAAALFKGDGATVDAIWRSIGAANRSIISPAGLPGAGQPAGGILGLRMSLLQGLAFPWAYLRTGLVWYWVLGLLASLAICLYVAETSRDGEARDGELRDGGPRENLARALVLYGTIVAGTLPLYALGWDWGRWIVASNVAFLFLFDRIDHLPAPLERLGTRIAPSLPRMTSRAAPMAIGLFLILFELTYRLPECCITGPTRHFVPH